MTDQIHATVRDHYAAAALQVLEAPAAGAACCGSDCGCGETAVQLSPGEAGPWGAGRYAPIDLVDLPDTAVLASLGCGNPVAVAELRPGETVLDLGSGGGIDVLLSAQRVGPSGRAIGVDMTDEMLELARRNAAEAGATNVEFLKGTIEALPLPAASIDVVISNCVINLAADKTAVFREIARVLRPGGRVGVSDVVADDRLTPAEREERGSFAGCIAGALSFGEYAAGLEAAGLTGVEITPTHEVTDGMFGAIVRARRPAGAASSLAIRPATDGDLGRVRSLLADANLPLDGVDAAFRHGIVAVENGVIVGAAAVEPYGTDGLLRSVAVEGTRRGTGLGRTLVTAGEALAREMGIEDLYLLTETAIEWFPRLGYLKLPRAAAPAAIATSVEFTVSCVDTGVLMHRRLPGRA